MKALPRFSVVSFQTVQFLPDGRVRPRGGGVAFFPLDEREGWYQTVERIVHDHFRWGLGRCLEIGIATLDEKSLAELCQRYGDKVYWQGGDG